ncbi:uncharacterized protein BP01DRAFT_361525 [Aspergillus saccharolyticus JOP 1030-1]|uniref:Uncharacterized protein n=1 Tax=Aspergillus saccharolyticus JOP 1030-1 TaxID=1450539 RepID=A0A318YYU2_9EURO|nr:hypothetical protein BP01DRAFT_361525 [Aspergillus saccharolyticus JOP 1030-1]PYH40135.1 hypothetical protein BP01DRAFT_361525 [Aspergillus saccharolyticus JOP 1030-1]
MRSIRTQYLTNQSQRSPAFARQNAPPLMSYRADPLLAPGTPSVLMAPTIPSPGNHPSVANLIYSILGPGAHIEVRNKVLSLALSRTGSYDLITVSIFE